MKTRIPQGSARWAIPAIISGALVLLGGCRSGPPPVRDVHLHLDSSHQSILVGESTTVMARVSEPIGHQTEVRWKTTGGIMHELHDARAVRITFEEPGTYRVHGQVYVDGKLADSAYVDIVVKPVA